MHYFGQGYELEREIMGNSVEYYRISAGKFRRYHNESILQRVFDVKTNLLNFRDGFKVILGIFQAWRQLAKIKPNVVFIKGGYVGLPVGLAAHLRGIPIVIHESDARPGLTNRVLAKYAHIIATGFPVKTYKHWQGKPIVYTGNPVRRSVLGAHKTSSRSTLRIDKSARVVLVMGGSGGAAAINAAVTQNLDKLCSRYTVIHITGKDKKLSLPTQVAKNGQHYLQYDFVIDGMAEVIAASDCVVARAGMNTISEVAAYGKPLVLVPAPQLSDQKINAKELIDAKAAVLVNQEDLLAQLPDVLEQVFSSKSAQSELSDNIKKFYRTKASSELANIIIQSARG